MKLSTKHNKFMPQMVEKDFFTPIFDPEDNLYNAPYSNEAFDQSQRFKNKNDYMDFLKYGEIDSIYEY